MKIIIPNLLILFVLTIFTVSFSQGRQVLIVMDEKPQMEVLSRFLESEGGLTVTIVPQDSLPADFSPFEAVVGYIHGKLQEKTELAIIDFTKNGGEYICLHHSISSGKSRNKYYFKFLGIQLDHPEKSSQPVEPGAGYGWTHGGEEGVTLTILNLNPHHYITNYRVNWGKEIDYTPSDFPSAAGHYPSLSFEKSEVYMNHKFTDGREKTVLCGFKFFDRRNGKMFMQDRAVWLKDYGKGAIVYFKMGHSTREFQNRNYSQMILNAINWRKNMK